MANRILQTMLGVACGALAAAVIAAPVTYEIDSNHTFPSFEADHMGGLSLWRGKVNSTSGAIILDKEAQTGTVDVTMDMATVDFGHQGLNDHAKTADLFDVAQFPTATYSGRLIEFRNGAPTAVDGTLTMKGVSKPLRLTINSFKCQEHPMQRREICGADASATFNRDEWNLDFGKGFGFDMGVTLRIQVEALVPATS